MTYIKADDLNVCKQQQLLSNKHAFFFYLFITNFKTLSYTNYLYLYFFFSCPSLFSSFSGTGTTSGTTSSLTQYCWEFPRHIRSSQDLSSFLLRHFLLFNQICKFIKDTAIQLRIRPFFPQTFILSLLLQTKIFSIIHFFALKFNKKYYYNYTQSHLLNYTYHIVTTQLTKELLKIPEYNALLKNRTMTGKK